jgi:hypothetical protein
MEDEERLSNGQTVDEWMEEKKKTDRMLQLIDKQHEKEDRRQKWSLFYHLNKRWQAKAERIAEQDEEYRRLKALDVRGKTSYNSDDLKAMHARYVRRHELVKQPKYFTIFRWKNDRKRDAWVLWHRFKFKKLHIRTDSPFWHHMHNNDWACPDCDSLFACRNLKDDPDHMCTAAIVDIDMVNLDELDDDGQPWSANVICWRCGYTGRMAQRRERKKLRGRAAR